MDKKLRKKQCREEVRKRLESLPKEYHEKASQKISEFLCGMEVFQKAGSIFCFVSTPTEVNTRSIIQHAWSGGKQDCSAKMPGKRSDGGVCHYQRRRLGRRKIRYYGTESRLQSADAGTD